MSHPINFPTPSLSLGDGPTNSLTQDLLTNEFAQGTIVKNARTGTVSSVVLMYPCTSSSLATNPNSFP